MAKGIYYVSLHPTGEPAQWVAVAFFPEAALATMQGIAMITATSQEGQGGKLFTWDGSKLAQGPIAGVDFGGLNWWPEKPLSTLWVAGEALGASVRDWFQEFMSQWAGNWWRR